VHHRRRGCSDAFDALDRVNARNVDENERKHQRYLPDDIYLLIYFSVNWPSQDKIHTE